MVDTLVLGTSVERRVGSSPTWGTIISHVKPHKVAGAVRYPDVVINWLTGQLHSVLHEAGELGQALSDGSHLG
jgi:hypothetical protein